MLLPSTRRPDPGASAAVVLLVFAGGSVLDAILRATSRYSPAAGMLPQLLLAAVPMFIAVGLWFCLRGQKELSGSMVLQLLLALGVGALGIGSALPLSWYLGIGLVLWAMRLGAGLPMWVGTSLLVLAAGARFGMIEYSGVLFLPFALTPPLFLGAAAYFQWHQVRHRQPETDADARQAAALHLKRYGREPGH